MLTEMEHPANGAVEPLPEAPTLVEGDEANSLPAGWHSEAGRKGALRVHELIERGRLYEKEHGLKGGRQRLRQLIEEGKLYEREHGLRPEGRKGRVRKRRNQREVMENFVQALTHMIKPRYRAELERLLTTLRAEQAA
jgi:hypothetical protein